MDKHEKVNVKEEKDDFSIDEEGNEEISLEEKETDDNKTRIGNKIYDLDI